MADSPILPGSHVRPLNETGMWSQPWYAYFRSLNTYVTATTGNATDLTALASRVTANEAAIAVLEGASAAVVTGPQSVQVSGSLAGGALSVRLRGDVQAPGNDYFYGTSATGVKGWYSRLLSTLADVDVTGLADSDLLRWDATAELWIVGSAVESVVATAGETTVDATDPNNPIVGLADLADAGTGALLALTRDGKGRLSGTRAVDAGDLTPILDSEYDALGSAAAALTAANTYTDDEITALSSVYQPLDGTLTALAGANWAANALPIGTGADTLAQTAFAANTFPARASTGNLVAKSITDFGLSLVDDADAATARTTLGLASGTYTPTLGNIANVAASTASVCRYMRTGDIVTVAGRIAIDPTAATTQTDVSISLPVASAIAATTDCAGVANSQAIGVGVIFGRATDDTALLRFTSTAVVSNENWYFTFMYSVL